MIRPKLFLDTNICINAANGNIPADEWCRVRKHISNRFRYQISFVTMKELFGKLARCADEYFEQNKAPLKVLYGPGKRRFLPYPSVFALRTLVGLNSISRRDEDLNLCDEEWAKVVMTSVLEAPSKAQLKAGIPVRKSIKRMMQTFDLDNFDQEEGQPQNEHAELLQGIREGRIDTPDPVKWAAWILHQHEVTPYAEDCAKLVEGLDAAYCFSCTLSKMTKDRGYNFQAHVSDWGDAMQLFYLCDESMHFLTMDQNCLNHTRESTQASRILLYRDVVQSLV